MLVSTGIYDELVVYFSEQEDENAKNGSRSSEVGMNFSEMLDTLSNHPDLIHINKVKIKIELKK